MKNTDDSSDNARVRLERDWTKGSIVSNLLSLSWPIIISSLIMHVGPVVDMIWVGKLGAASVAGVGVAAIVVTVVNAGRQGLQTGTRAMVSRFVGAGDRDGANLVAQQTLVVSVAYAVVMAIIGTLFAEQILLLLGLDADVATEGAAYLRIQLIGMVAMSFAMMNQSIMQASGDAITPMRIDLGYRLFHILLCPFLIFGWWIFPPLGVSGAALSSVISQSIGGSIGFWILYSGRTRLQLTLKNFRLNRQILWRIVKIGVPASLTHIERSFSRLILVWFIAPFGTFAVAAHSLAQRIDGFLHMPASGLGQGSGVLAGQNLGAGQPKRAEKTAWLAAAMFTAFMSISSIIVWFWAENIVCIFNTESGLIGITSIFLKINIVSYMVFGLEMVLMNCLNNIGDTMIPMITTLVTMWLIQTPLAYYLPRVTNLGVYGVRWAIIIAEVGRAVTYTIYFKTGRWQRKKV
ncbi:MATE family efflux transporter [Chloroflexota bacterium]